MMPFCIPRPGRPGGLAALATPRAAEALAAPPPDRDSQRQSTAQAAGRRRRHRQRSLTSGETVDGGAGVQAPRLDESLRLRWQPGLPRGLLVIDHPQDLDRPAARYAGVGVTAHLRGRARGGRRVGCGRSCAGLVSAGPTLQPSVGNHSMPASSPSAAWSPRPVHYSDRPAGWPGTTRCSSRPSRTPADQLQSVTRLRAWHEMGRARRVGGARPGAACALVRACCWLRAWPRAAPASGWVRAGCESNDAICSEGWGLLRPGLMLLCRPPPPPPPG